MPVFRYWLSTAILVACGPWLAAAEPVTRELVARDLASPKMALLIEVDRPMQLIDNALGRDVWDLLRQTNGAQQALASPEIDRFRLAGKFIEKSLGGDWHTGLARLTAGGIFVVVQPTKPPAEPAVTVVVTAADEQTLKQFIDAVQVEIRRSANAATAAGNTPAESAKDKSPARKAPEAETSSYGSFSIHRVGNGYFSLVGRQLIASNAKDQLESTLDCLADPAAAPAFALPASLRLVDASGSAPAVLATANLKMVREDPKTRAGLVLPAGDLLSPFLLGGYLDLFRRADFGTAGLFVDGPAYEVQIRFPVGSRGAYAGLRGFFATEQAESVPPLLRPTGTIFSAGWFRDYQLLWEARSELVTPEPVRELDTANERELARNDGLRVGISDFVKWIGPHFRVVAARQRAVPTELKDSDELPAVALVVSLRDENALRDRILLPVHGLLLAARRNHVVDYETADYRGAMVTQIRFARNAGNNFLDKSLLALIHPVYATFRGQLIVGSTAEIVRDLIDDLERQSQAGSNPESGSEQVTDRQNISLAELSEFLKSYRDRMERDAMREQGLSQAAAAKEIDIFHKLLKRLGTLTTGSVVAPDHFDIRVRLGGGGE